MGFEDRAEAGRPSARAAAPDPRPQPGPVADPPLLGGRDYLVMDLNRQAAMAM
ncbi:hypothetical protein [Nocardia sp. NPDC051981]|uniref:hypothetical protein n=1 Tax=Nocardia sp. NPDC051981 TaxID=3155417 RepID=UPI00342B0B82